MHYEHDSLKGLVGLELSAKRYDLAAAAAGSRWRPKPPAREAYGDVRGASPLRGGRSPPKTTQPEPRKSYAHIYEQHGYSFLAPPARDPRPMEMSFETLPPAQPSRTSNTLLAPNRRAQNEGPEPYNGVSPLKGGDKSLPAALYQSTPEKRLGPGRMGEGLNNHP